MADGNGKPLAVLFSGTSGLKKAALLQRFQAYLRYHASEFFPSVDKARPADELFPILELPLYRWTPHVPPGALYSEIDTVLALGRRPFEAALARRPACILLHTHMTYFNRGQYVSWLNASPMQNILPYFDSVNLRHVVVLIDNIFDVRSKIDPDFSLTLKDLLNWRDVEVLVSDVFSRGLTSVQKNSTVYSVRHSMWNLANLIFTEKPKLYLSYSISEIRRLQNSEDEKKREAGSNFLKQNIEFRHFMERDFITFDPAAIDEMPLLLKHNEWTRDGKAVPEFVQLHRSELWPVAEPRNCLADPRDKITDIPFSEVREICGTDNPEARSIVEKQMRIRDYRLIDQADGLLAYRPSISENKSRMAQGCDEEIGYVAQGAQKARRPFYIIKDEADARLSAGALGREYIPGDFHEWRDLDNANTRANAFEQAAKMISEKIERYQSR